MKKIVKSFITHPLISGSSVIFAGSLITNVVNYVFNLVMARTLLNEYGALASLISIINILFVFSTTVTTVFTKFTAVFAAKNDVPHIQVLIRKGFLWIGSMGLLLAIILFLLSNLIAQFLHINQVSLLHIISATMFFVCLISVPYGVMQGLLKFFSYTSNTLFSALMKLFVSIGFVYLGFGLVGAVLGFLVSILFSLSLSVLQLKRYIFHKSTVTINLADLKKELARYSGPTLLSNLGFTAFIAIDIILVKHFFTDAIASDYAALSLIGRTIFFFVAPISFVLFPLIAQKKEKGEPLTKTLLLSIFLVGFPSTLLCIIYFLVPELIVLIFFQGRYANITQFLGPFSLFIVFYTLSFLLNNFYFAIGKTKVSILTAIALICEIIYISFFHSTINQVVYGLDVITFLLLICLLLYYPHANKQA